MIVLLGSLLAWGGDDMPRGVLLAALAAMCVGRGIEWVLEGLGRRGPSRAAYVSGGAASLLGLPALLLLA